MRITFLFFFVFSIGGCEVMNDDVLSLPKQTYSGNQIKINGYYYLGDSKSIYGSYFFYENGVLINGGGEPENNFLKLESNFKSSDWIERRRSYKGSWGVFVLDGNFVKYEHWYCAEGFCKAYVGEGEILNDTTFIVTQSYRIRNGQKTEISVKNETYRFRSFGPKPDSSNVFIP